MDFELTAEQLAIKKNAAEFAEKEIKPLVSEMEKEKRTPWELILKMRGLDFYSIQYPCKFGGAGYSYMEYVLAMEEISKIDASVSVAISAIINCNP